MIDQYEPIKTQPEEIVDRILNNKSGYKSFHNHSPYDFEKLLSESDKIANPSAVLNLYGQELNPESHAICKADMMIKGQDPENIKKGNAFTEDGLPNEKFDYMLSNRSFPYQNCCF